MVEFAIFDLLKVDLSSVNIAVSFKTVASEFLRKYNEEQILHFRIPIWPSLSLIIHLVKFTTWSTPCHSIMKNNLPSYPLLANQISRHVILPVCIWSCWSLLLSYRTYHQQKLVSTYGCTLWGRVALRAELSIFLRLHTKIYVQDRKKHT